MKSITINLLKIVASQFIMFHHFALYGPLAKSFEFVFPELSWFFKGYGLHAVQIFLVIGGYLASTRLANKVFNFPQFFQIVWRRYKRLFVPYASTIVIVILISAFARQFTSDSIVPEAPTITQVATHLLFLQGILQQPSLTVGVWYIGIDFQLYVLIAIFSLMANCLRSRIIFTFFLAAGCFSSILWFRTLNPYWGEFAVWFLFSYGFGALASQRTSVDIETSSHLINLIALFLCALLLFGAFITVNDCRFIAALITGLILMLLPIIDKQLSHLPCNLKDFIETQGQRSFALFLMHFPAGLLVNAAQDYWQWNSPLASKICILFAWAGSMVAAAAFSHVITPSNKNNGPLYLFIIYFFK